MLTIWLAVCALTILAALADVAALPVYGDGDVVAAGSSVMHGM
jgi:hypothetical protein